MANALKDMEYPGRGIILGLTKDESPFCSYFITGRSDSSRARRLCKSGKVIYTEPTDMQLLMKGNPDLLIYNALLWRDNCVVVSNGKHTDSMFAQTLCDGRHDGFRMSYTPLDECVKQWSYEPDAPNYTPRIGGRIMVDTGSRKEHLMELVIVRRSKEVVPVRTDYKVSCEPGEGRLITTYNGENKNPLSCFGNSPLKMSFKENTSEGICNEISDLLREEFRVSVAALVVSPSDCAVSAYIRNFRD